MERKKLRADIRMTNNGGVQLIQLPTIGDPDYLLDINITSAIYNAKLPHAKELLKQNKYLELCGVNGLVFIPVCFSISGEWHPLAISLFNAIIGKMTASDDSDNFLRSKSVFYWKSYLSIALIRANSKQKLDKLEKAISKANITFQTASTSRAAMIVSDSFDSLSINA